jgi:hypothetical protein
MNDLKSMMFELAHHQGYAPAAQGVPAEHMMASYEPGVPDNTFNTPAITNYPGADKKVNPSFVIHHPGEEVNHHEEVEESLSLIDREKEFIIKSLQKHKGKRKDAAHCTARSRNMI